MNNVMGWQCKLHSHIGFLLEACVEAVSKSLPIVAYLLCQPLCADNNICCGNLIVVMAAD